MKEFIGYAKANPTVLNYAFVSGGSDSQLAGELLKIQAGINMEGIGYKGVGPAYLEQMAGRIHLTIGTTAATMPHVKAGKIRAIAITNNKRSSTLPNIPSINETLPAFDTFNSRTGIFGVEGMSPAIIAALNKDINLVLEMPDIQKLLATDGSETTPGPPEQLRDSMATSLESARRIVKQANLHF